MALKTSVWSALLLLSLSGAQSLGAEVFRSVGPDGTVSYSDRPAAEDAETVRVRVARPDATAPAPVLRRNREATAATEPDQIGPEADRRSAAEQAEDRAAKCAAAREKLERFLRARRIFREVEGGEREYLDDAGIDAARERAANEVESACES